MESGMQHGATFSPDETENPNDTPTVAEYKKLKRVMRIMTKFYEDGSAAKLEQAQDMEYELQKVETDLRMVNAQLDAMKPFPNHPKKEEYTRDLTEEKEKLDKMHANFTKRVTDFKNLYKWSLGIVDVVRWLVLGLDDYCVNHLKMDLDIVAQPIPKPTAETYAKYKEGLDEVYLNLHESQDFFQASLDGRLAKYHNIEKDLIAAQIKAIEEFPPMNPRKAHWDEELEKDLEFVIENMKETPESSIKRSRMLKMHTEFESALSWFKTKLSDFAAELGIKEEDSKTEEKEHPTDKRMKFMNEMEEKKE